MRQGALLFRQDPLWLWIVVMWIISGYLIWTAETVGQLYKARWDIEVFFKSLKQLFRVKSFVGTSPNAVRIQM